MTFAKINWNPQPKELRIFGITLLVALGLVGSLFYFVLSKVGFAYFLWSFGFVAFLTAITGTRLGMPCYLLWMGFVFVISTCIGYASLVLIYFCVVFPLGLIARLVGRDRLNLKKKRSDSYWEKVVTQTTEATCQKQY